MRVAILCPGPSIAQTWKESSRPWYDLTIAVNRAAQLGCDWWQAHDHDTFERWSKIAKVRTGLCTWAHNWDSYRYGRYHLQPGLTWQDAELLPDAGFRYHCLSMLGAMGFATLLSATEVEIYGADWDGDADFDGAAFTESRTPARWSDERAYFDRLCAAWKHVRFTRVQPRPMGCIEEGE